MRRKVVAIFSVVVGVLLFSVGSSAHHGASVVYNLNQKVTMTGTVADYQFVNPHVLIFFEVTAEDGTAVVWSAGLTSPNRLARSDGWSRDTLKPGDQVSILGSPARGGAPSLWVQQVFLDGTPLLGS